jgi:hypothetical protein
MEGAMAGFRILNIHRNWEDWLGMLLGVVIGLSPWLANEMTSSAVMWNAVVLGALVIGLASLELVALQRWEEAGEAVCGAWLVASPFVFGYAAAGALRYWHFVLGAAVVVLALLETWQDWKLSERELAQHGR